MNKLTVTIEPDGDCTPGDIFLSNDTARLESIILAALNDTLADDCMVQSVYCNWNRDHFVVKVNKAK